MFKGKFPKACSKGLSETVRIGQTEQKQLSFSTRLSRTEHWGESSISLPTTTLSSALLTRVYKATPHMFHTLAKYLFYNDKTEVKDFFLVCTSNCSKRIRGLMDSLYISMTKIHKG